MRVKTAAELQEELDQNRQQLTETTERSDQLEEAGDASPENVTEMQVLTARGQLLNGAIKRLEKELEVATRREGLERVIELRKTMEVETEAARVAAHKLADKAIKLLVPAAPDASVGWSGAFCERRKKEILTFAGQHPDIRKHTAVASRAKVELEKLQDRLRGAA